MNLSHRIFIILMVVGGALLGPVAQAADDAEYWAPTPPRLSFIDGDVSYLRSGATEWASAPINLPLAFGDALYTGNNANLEVQFGSQRFVRADEHSQVSLIEQSEQGIHFKVTGGLVSFDIRRLGAGERVEVSTPNALFLIEQPGYYRVEVNSRDTHFITRRGGAASLTTADGRNLIIYPSEDIVVSAGKPVRVATYAAPSPDAWDRWNDERSDRLGESVSARYLPPGVYGAEELDHYGHWRVVATYGAVWIPYGVGIEWAPYSSGYWIWDPYYEWTWIDTMPWGWAPFHYGRWVYIDGFWAWAPGPVVRHPVYAPALVGFMAVDSRVSLRINIGLPGVWWVALGWGEPLIPWWHRHRHRGTPRWDGWGGPRIVNNTEVRVSPFVDVDRITYRNATVSRAVHTAPLEKFARERSPAMVETRLKPSELRPLRELSVKPRPANLHGGAPRGIQPPRALVSRPVVVSRPPPETRAPWQGAPRATERREEASRYVVPSTPRATQRSIPQRPPFGAEAGPEVTPPPSPPRYRELRRDSAPMMQPRSRTTVREQASEERRQQEQQRQPARGGELREERGGREQRALPGQPANQPHKRRAPLRE